MTGRGFVLAALTLGLAGCAVGPNFHRPAPPAVSAYRAGDLPPVATADSAIEAAWWTRFGNPALDALVARGLAHSPGVAAAQARLRSAQAEMRAGYGALFPAVDASADATRERYSQSRVGQAGAGSVFSLFTPSLAVSYVIDVFGGNRRQIEALRASAQGQAETLRATRLTLAGNIVAAVVVRAQSHEQVEAWQAIVAALDVQLGSARARTQAGSAALSTELALSQQRETALAGLAEAQARAGQADDVLAVLVGDPPASAQLPEISLQSLHMPATMPTRLPSDLVRSRPDILLAEASAHAASAGIGVATAAMLPQVTLSAGTGSSTNSLGRLFGAGTGVWSYGAGVTAPLFEGGALANRRVAAKAEFAAAMADYRQVVLTAFGQVAEALTALDADGTSDRAGARALADAQTAWDLAQVQSRAGLISEAEREASRVTWQQARITALAARAAHVQDMAALIVALGGGEPVQAP